MNGIVTSFIFLILSGFVWFVLSLVKKYYLRQFSLFAWTHVALLCVVTQSYLIIQNMFQVRNRGRDLILHNSGEVGLKQGVLIEFAFDVLSEALNNNFVFNQINNIVILSGPYLVHHAPYDGDYQRHHGIHVRLLHGPHPAHQDQP